jgi:hypothetical protein
LKKILNEKRTEKIVSMIVKESLLKLKEGIDSGPCILTCYNGYTENDYYFWCNTEHEAMEKENDLKTNNGNIYSNFNKIQISPEELSALKTAKDFIKRNKIYDVRQFFNKI